MKKIEIETVVRNIFYRCTQIEMFLEDFDVKEDIADVNLSSKNIVSIIADIEKTFRITFYDIDFVPSYLQTIHSISEYISHKVEEGRVPQ